MITGGCPDPVRGRAAREREDMTTNNIKDKEKYKALSACVHCKNGTLHNCPNAKRAKEHFKD